MVFTWCLAGILLVSGFSGCSGARHIKISGTGEDAIDALRTALNAWKSGRTPDDLLEADAIRINDQDWHGGGKLIAYTIDKQSPAQSGGDWRVTAFLTVSTNGVQAGPYPVAYDIGLEPSIGIFRVEVPGFNP